EQMADHLEALGRTLTRNEEGRIEFSRQLYGLNDRLSALAETMRTEQSLMLKLAEAQMELKPILARLAERPAGESMGTAHLRNMEAYLARIANEIATGRVQSVQDIRNEIRLLARTIAALPEE
ncbi:MAG: flagellar motor protein MotA, partial [Alphaproteobacteria bacterium]